MAWIIVGLIFVAGLAYLIKKEVKISRKKELTGAICLLAGTHNGALALKTATNRQRHEGRAGASVADGDGAGSATIVVVGALGNGAVLDQGEVDGRHDDLLEESDLRMKTLHDLIKFKIHYIQFFREIPPL